MAGCCPGALLVDAIGVGAFIWVLVCFVGVAGV